MLFLSFLGCTDLLPGESVIPGEIGVQHYESYLGASIAVFEDNLYVAADGVVTCFPDCGETEDLDGYLRWIWAFDNQIYGAGVNGLANITNIPLSISETNEAVSISGNQNRFLICFKDSLKVVDINGLVLKELSITGVQRGAVGIDRELFIKCEDKVCSAWEWTDKGVFLLGDAGDGGVIEEIDSVAWWTDPELETAKGNGKVFSEEGDLIYGLEGDHLGRSICSGFVGGVFNKWLVPARIRIVPINGGEVLAIDQGTEATSMKIACNQSILGISYLNEIYLVNL